MNVDIGKTEVVFSSGTTKDCLSKSKFDPCGVCSWKVEATSVICVQCGERIHSGHGGVKMVTTKLSTKFCLQEM